MQMQFQVLSYLHTMDYYLELSNNVPFIVFLSSLSVVDNPVLAPSVDTPDELVFIKRRNTHEQSNYVKLQDNVRGTFIKLTQPYENQGPSQTQNFRWHNSFLFS